jgi:hypothetical protein
MNYRKMRMALAVALITVTMTGVATALPEASVALTTAASTLDGEPVVDATVTGSLRLTRHLDLLVSGTAIHTLERSYSDNAGRPYQSETAWTGLGLRPFIPVGERVEIGLPYRSSTGVIQFRYERPYRDEVSWTEEILDRENIVVNSLGVDVRVAVSDRWGIVAEAGGRVSSPVRTVVPVDEQALNGWYGGVGASYHFGGDS